MKGGGGREREVEMGKGGICAFVIFPWENRGEYTTHWTGANARPSHGIEQRERAL